MRSKGGSAGFTLMEVLISVVILSLLMLVGSLAISLFLDNWQKDRVESEKDIPRFIRWILLRDAVEGTYDYYVKLSPGMTEYIPYFRSFADGFEFATVNPLWSGSGTALARVRFRRSGELFDLTYEESALDNKYLACWNDVVNYEHGGTMLKGIRSYSIDYFGAKHLVTAGLFQEPEEALGAIGSPVSNEDVYGWFPSYNGDERRILPRKIRVSITFQDGRQQVLLYLVRTWNLQKTWRFNEQEL
jgi:prepilin-type N-terminal cleavage/methylation domain-containing protein